MRYVSQFDNDDILEQFASPQDMNVTLDEIDEALAYDPEDRDELMQLRTLVELQSLNTI